jgi:hypothetical protein
MVRLLFMEKRHNFVQENRQQSTDEKENIINYDSGIAVVDFL